MFAKCFEGSNYCYPPSISSRLHSTWEPCRREILSKRSQSCRCGYSLSFSEGSIRPLGLNYSNQLQNLLKETEGSHNYITAFPKVKDLGRGLSRCQQTGFRRPQHVVRIQKNLCCQTAHEKVPKITNYQRKTNQDDKEVSPHTGQNSHHQVSPQIINAGENVEKRKPTLLHWWWECKWVQPRWRTVRRILIKRWRTVRRILIKPKIQLPHDPAIPLLGVYPKMMKTLIHKDTCIPEFTVALLTIAKTWKQPECPSTGEWIEMLYIHIIECHLTIKIILIK